MTNKEKIMEKYEINLSKTISKEIDRINIEYDNFIKFAKINLSEDNFSKFIKFENKKRDELIYGFSFESKSVQDLIDTGIINKKEILTLQLNVNTPKKGNLLQNDITNKGIINE